jgi:uncharacterized protein with HEPN domain
MTNPRHGAVRQMVDAIDAVTRYSLRGCSSMACDRARRAWMANQLAVIGQQAASVDPALRSELGDVPWDRLESFGESETLSGMTADEMQQFVERELPAIGKQLKQLLSQESPSRRTA